MFCEPSRTPVKMGSANQHLSHSKMDREQANLYETPSKARLQHTAGKLSILATADRERARESSMTRGADINASVEELRAIVKVQQQINDRFKILESKMSGIY